MKIRCKQCGWIGSVGHTAECQGCGSRYITPFFRRLLRRVVR